MALVRIDFHHRRPATFGNAAALLVNRVMQRVLNVPPAENYLVSTAHTDEHVVYDPDRTDAARTERIVFIQITLNEGRSGELKQSFYSALTASLHQELEIPPQDVFINLVEVKRENWCFGR